MSRLGARAAAIAAFAVFLGVLDIALAAASDHTVDRAGFLAAVLGIGWSFVATGLYAVVRTDAKRIGELMILAGIAWLATGLFSANVPVVFIAGALVGVVSYGFLVHMLIAFPTGLIRSRLERIVVVAGYLVVTVGQVPPFLFMDTEVDAECINCPPNPLLVHADNGLADALFGVQAALGSVVLIVFVVALVRRWRSTASEERASLAPVLWAGAGTLGLQALLLAASVADVNVGAVATSSTQSSTLFFASWVPFAPVTFAFGIGLLRGRAAALTVDNDRLAGEVRANVAELRASRARIVEAGYEQRKQLERDLHDGAQQRLMAVGMSLQLARMKAAEGSPETPGLIDEAIAELAEATAELRELARGIHPAVLTDLGLGAAVKVVAARSSVPVTLAVSTGGRLPPAVEAAGYFVIAEAITNVGRYAEAEAAEVSVVRADGHLRVSITDDGNGGADPARGSGLRGLADRVAALDGELRVTSPAGAGTTISAWIPCE